MIIILIERTLEGICSEKEAFYRKFSPQTRVHVTSKTEIDAIKCLQHPPLLQAGWLIEVDLNVDKTQLMKLGSLDDQNVILFTVENNKQFLKVKELLIKAKLKFRVIDNLQPSDEKLLRYVYSELNITEDAAKYLLNRYHRYLPDIIIAVNSLQRFELVDKKIIQRYAPAAKKVALYELIPYLIGYESRISYKQAVSLIYDFQYGNVYLLSYIVESLEQYIAVFEQIEAGNLSAGNIEQFKQSTSVSALKEINSYQLLKMIDSYSHVSMEKLYYFYYRIKSMKRDRFSLYRLIYLLKINEEG